MFYPEDLYYSADHEWLRIEGDTARAGITSFATAELGDIVYVDIFQPGEALPAGAVFGSIEAVKTVSDLFLPAAGTIIEINPLLADQPDLINSDPYGKGWLVRIRLEGNFELMNAEAYQKITGHV